jgi:hypothetical protein
MKYLARILLYAYWSAWIIIGLTGAWLYYFAFRIRDAWKAVRR